MEYYPELGGKNGHHYHVFNTVSMSIGSGSHILTRISLAAFVLQASPGRVVAPPIR